MIKEFTALVELDQYEQQQSRDSLEEIDTFDTKKVEEPSATVMVSED